MQTVFSLASSLALASLLLPARAQTALPTTTPSLGSAQAKAIRAKTAERRAEAYQGPKVVPDSKKLGQKMPKDSKPADAIRIRASQLK